MFFLLQELNTEVFEIVANKELAPPMVSQPAAKLPHSVESAPTSLPPAPNTISKTTAVAPRILGISSIMPKPHQNPSGRPIPSGAMRSAATSHSVPGLPSTRESSMTTMMPKPLLNRDGNLGPGQSAGGDRTSSLTANMHTGLSLPRKAQHRGLKSGVMPAEMTGVAPWRNNTTVSVVDPPIIEEGSPVSKRLDSRKDGYQLLCDYIELCLPSSTADEAATTSWHDAQASPTPTHLPSLRFHELVFGRELGTGAFSTVKYARQIIRVCAFVD